MKHGLRIRHASSVHLMLVLHLLLSLLLHGDVGQAVLVLMAAGSGHLLLAEPLPILRLRVLRVERALVADVETLYV